MAFKHHTSFSHLLNHKEFIVSAELTPPRHYVLTDFIRKADVVSQYVDYVQINDHLLSKARINNIIAGQQCKLAQLEVVLQFALIHKNRIALQGDLLAMAASELTSLIVLGGYPCSLGSDPDATDVLDLNPIEAISKISALTREGKLFNGDVISPPPPFTIGTIEFPCSKTELSANIDRLEEKIDAGVDFVQIQAVFELAPLEHWMNEIVKRGLNKRARFLGAIFPFKNAERLEELKKIPGLHVPLKLLHRLNKTNTKKESLSILMDLIKGITSINEISGLHIRSIGDEEFVPELVESSGLRQEMIY